MIIEQLIKEKRKIKYRYLSEHSQKGKIAVRYIDYSPIYNFNRGSRRTVEESSSCTVRATGVSCECQVSNVNVENVRNEPTEPLKNMKKTIHTRFVPNAPLLSHNPKYGGWIDPYKFRVKPKKKEKTYDYY
jgi:hypothetical protein